MPFGLPLSGQIWLLRELLCFPCVVKLALIVKNECRVVPPLSGGFAKLASIRWQQPYKDKDRDVDVECFLLCFVTTSAAAQHFSSSLRKETPG